MPLCSCPSTFHSETSDASLLKDYTMDISAIPHDDISCSIVNIGGCFILTLKTGGTEVMPTCLKSAGVSCYVAPDSYDYEDKEMFS